MGVMNETKAPQQKLKCDPTRFLRIKDVIDRVGLSRTTIWRLEATGEFPKSVRVSEGRSAWIESEIQSWIEAKISERDSGPGDVLDICARRPHLRA